MTDRIKGLTVILDDDYRDDDMQSMIDAIKCLRGVLTVKPVEKHSADDLARIRVKRELSIQLLQMLEDK